MITSMEQRPSRMTTTITVDTQLWDDMKVINTRKNRESGVRLSNSRLVEKILKEYRENNKHYL